jgi:hypothetical protein
MFLLQSYVFAARLSHSGDIDELMEALASRSGREAEADAIPLTPRSAPQSQVGEPSTGVSGIRTTDAQPTRQSVPTTT